MVAMPKITPPRCYTPEEYFEIDERAEERLEYVDGEILAMAGTSLGHNKVAGNIYLNLRLLFRGRSCEVFMESIRVRVSETRYRYPDIVALCGAAQVAETRPPTLLNPMVIFEVLSPSTKNKDVGEKFDEYAQNDTMTDYILVAQDTMRVRHYRRLNENDWQVSSYTKAEDIVRLESLNVSLTLADIYNEITFPKQLTLLKERTTRKTVRKKP